MNEKQTAARLQKKPERKARPPSEKTPVTGRWATVPFSEVVTTLARREGTVLHMADGTRWRVVPEHLAIIDSWREFDPVAGSGFWRDATVTNLRRGQTVSATRLAPGEE